MAMREGNKCREKERGMEMFRKRRGPQASEKEASGTHVAETALPLIFFPPAVLCNSSLKISCERRRSINKHKGRRE